MAKTDKKDAPDSPSGSRKYDLVIIGSGPAGIHCSVQASKLGKRVAIVEKTPGKLGGAWIHTGTIPSKTLRESLATLHSIRFHAGDEWVHRLVNSLSAEQLIGRAFKVANQEESVVRRYLERNNIEIIEGMGILEDAHAVRVIPNQGDAYVLSAEKILIATGSRPRRPNEIPFDGWRIVDSDELLHLKTAPKKMVIYGAGVIGCEYACIFNSLGTEVIITDSRTEVMQNLDREITSELKKIMEDSGIRFEMEQKFEKVSTEGPKAMVKFEKKTMECDLFFFAAGRVSITKNIGLEKLGIKTGERGEISVNEHFQTSVPSIYAAGDAIGMPALAATSAEQGRHAACHAFKNKTREFPKVYPIGIYTIPEMSSVGKSEEQLQKEKIEYVVGRASFDEVARGYIRGDHHGLLKILVCKKTHKMLGIHVVGADACNLVHIGLGFMLYDGKVHDIVDKMIFNYPTLAETYRIAGFNAINKLTSEVSQKDTSDLEENNTPTKIKRAV